MTPRRALGRTLYRLPPGLRSVLPPRMRESIRHRIGPFAPWEQGFSFVPPPVPSGQTTGPPDFVGIGVQKAGTTWWYELLASHPAVHHVAAAHKERHFFARFAMEQFGGAAVAEYHGWFPRPPGTITGEWTPDYLHQPWVPPLLHAAAPSARLLVMVRDPVERFRSGVAHDALGRASHPGSVLAEAVRRGFYARSLDEWTARFPAEQVLVLQYERCVADPAGELARTLRFLGVAGEGAMADPRRAVSPTRDAKVDLPDDARRRLVELYAPDVDELLRRYPALTRELWPNFSGR